MPASSSPEAELRELYETHGPVVFRRCRRILGNEEDARDATQEVFARAMQTWESYRGEGSRQGWIMRISTNHCLNVIRNRKSRRSKLDQRKLELPGVGGGVEVPQSIEHTRAVRRALERAEPQVQKLAIHFWFDEMSKEEIARTCGISVPTVRKRLKIFLEKARKELSVGLAGATP